jgi:hypothetical protein
VAGTGPNAGEEYRGLSASWAPRTTKPGRATTPTATRTLKHREGCLLTDFVPRPQRADLLSSGTRGRASTAAGPSADRRPRRRVRVEVTWLSQGMRLNPIRRHRRHNRSGVRRRRFRPLQSAELLDEKEPSVTGRGLSPRRLLLVHRLRAPKGCRPAFRGQRDSARGSPVRGGQVPPSRCQFGVGYQFQDGGVTGQVSSSTRFF